MILFEHEHIYSRNRQFLLRKRLQGGKRNWEISNFWGSHIIKSKWNFPKSKALH